MLSKSTHATRRRSGSKLAISFVIATGLVGTAVFEAPAEAQRAPREQQQRQPAQDQSRPNYSRDFVQAYQPVAEIANAEAGDFASARGQLEQVYAAIANDDDRHAAGNLTLILGNKLRDASLQRRGLEMMLQSGKVPAEQVGQFHFLVGNLAAAAQDWAAARTSLLASIEAGFTQESPQGIIAETYFRQNQHAQGLDYLKGVIEQRRAAAQDVPEEWILRGLQVAYNNRLPEMATDYSALLVTNDPSQESWTQALQVVNSIGEFDPQARLDLLRLMKETGALTARQEYLNYIEVADVRVMSNEVLRVLEQGIAQGIFTPGETYYTDIKQQADERAPADRRDAPGLAEEARGSDRGTPAQSAGDVYFSLADYAQAEAMYALALEKGGVDRDRNLTRLGIAQALQGKKAEAKATFGQVSGQRASVARMWAAYVDSQA